MSINTTLQAHIENLKNNAPTADSATSARTSDARQVEWDRETIVFENIAPSTQQPYSFTYIGKKTITDVASSCGCTSSLLENNKVSGAWVIPVDFSYTKDTIVNSDKTITVTFSDNSIDILTLKATINKKLYV